MRGYPNSVLPIKQKVFIFALVDIQSTVLSAVFTHVSEDWKGLSAHSLCMILILTL